MVSVYDERSEWHAAIERAKEACLDFGEGVDVVIQPRALGFEVSSDWLVVDGEPFFMNWARRVFHPLFGIEAGHINPAFGVKNTLIWTKVRKVVQVLGLRSGPLKVDFMVSHDASDAVILEMTGRWSGGLDSCWSALEVGLNLPRVMAAWSVECSLSSDDYGMWNSLYAGVYSPLLPPGDWHQWKFFLPQSVNVLWARPMPIQVRRYRHNAERAVFLGTVGTSPEEVWGRLVFAGQGVGVD